MSKIKRLILSADKMCWIGVERTITLKETIKFWLPKKLEHFSLNMIDWDLNGNLFH